MNYIGRIVNFVSAEIRIHSRVEVLEQEEGGDDDEDEEQGVVVEDGEGRGLVVGDFVFLPQDPKKQHERSLTLL